MSLWMTEDLGWILQTKKDEATFAVICRDMGLLTNYQWEIGGQGKEWQLLAEDLHEMSRTRADKQSKKLAQRIKGKEDFGH